MQGKKLHEEDRQKKIGHRIDAPTEDMAGQVMDYLFRDLLRRELRGRVGPLVCRRQ